MEKEKINVINLISEILAWAEVGLQSVPRGKTIPDLNENGNIIREFIMSKWQKIDTAPVGQDIIALVDGKAVQGFIAKESRKFIKEGFESDGCGCCAGSDPEPTHWMRLPNPPGDEE